MLACGMALDEFFYPGSVKHTPPVQTTSFTKDRTCIKRMIVGCVYFVGHEARTANMHLHQKRFWKKIVPVVVFQHFFISLQG